MVCPSIAFTTSPGFKAHAEGMFSQSGARTTMFIGSCKADAADTTDTTHAAPPMSALILSMLADGFSDIPPVSNVTPTQEDFQSSRYTLCILKQWAVLVKLTLSNQNKWWLITWSTMIMSFKQPWFFC